MKAATEKKLKGARLEDHVQLLQLPNIMGSAIGYKRRAGVRTRTPAVIVYVDKKLPVAALTDGERVPATLFGNQLIPTDVVQLGRLVNQLGTSPWFCRDRIDNQGTVTTLCKSSHGKLYGLTCAHCIAGEDRNLATSDPVFLWDSNINDYIEVGSSGPYADNTGYGIDNNFGFSDWGLFAINDSSLRIMAEHTGARATSFPSIGTVLQARTSHGVIRGVVEHSCIELGDNRFADIAIHIEEGATFPGDSGVLWSDTNGRAVAIHAVGLHDPNGSKFSFAMFAQRIANDLAASGITMLSV